MKSTGRVAKSFSNIVTGIGANLLTITLGIISRKIFVNYIGVEILGVNGVITSIISMLNLAELGVGTAISQSLYAPLSENDNIQVHAIMNLFSKLYKYIAFIVLAIGIVVFPFLKYIVHSEISMEYVNFIYIISLANTLLSYFISYRRNILLADQKGYIINNVSIVSSVLVTVVQVVLMVFTGNFIVYLLISVINNIVQNLYLFYKTDKIYPYLKKKKNIQVSKDITEKIFRNVKALFVARISVYLVYSTDNIILSTLISTYVVGLYSNYTLIINPIKQIISQIFNGVTPSFGNYLVTNDTCESIRLFGVMQFINFWVSTFATVGFLLLFNPTITIWLGEGMIFDSATVFVIVLAFYLDSMRSAIETARNAAGMYSPYPAFKYLWFAQAVINIGLSVLLAKVMNNGTLGVFLATCFSHILPTIVVPRDMFKYVFKRSGKGFYIKLTKYYCVSFCVILFSIIVSNLVEFRNQYFLFIYNFCIVILLPNMIILLFYRKSDEFRYLYNRFIKKSNKF